MGPLSMELKLLLKKPVFVVLLLLIAALAAFYYMFISAPAFGGEIDRYVISSSTDRSSIPTELRKLGLIRSQTAFKMVLSLSGGEKKIENGAYRVAPTMNLWQIVGTLTGKPYMKWVSIPEGLRKEEIADLLAKQLSWDEEERQRFLNPPPSVRLPQSEGYYFPDTYLIPLNESGDKVAERMLDRFNEKFQPLYIPFVEANVKHTTAVKLASILEREAAGEKDIRLIAGILWNRLEQGMKLDIDATIQYAKGSSENGWWPRLKSSDKFIESPFNTYQNKGLPPEPISNPGIMALEAVLNPEKTDCIFYLHDKNRKIYCSKTYAQHLANIDKYLR